MMNPFEILEWILVAVAVAMVLVVGLTSIPVASMVVPAFVLAVLIFGVGWLAAQTS